MQKTKFKIQGMHCQSCVALIEKILKNLNGIISAKVSFESGKAAVMYDQAQVAENDIYQAVKNAGEYQVSEIENEVEPKSGLNDTAENENAPLAGNEKKTRNFSKIMFILGFLASFSLISLILNIILVNKITLSGLTANVKIDALKQNIPDKNQQPSPSNQAPIAQFEITKNNHIRGDFEAPITLVEFSDFECPFCERFYPTVKKLLEDYQGKVRLVYKHFPLGFHANAQKAAEASECADEQETFWEYHDKLFENQPSGYSLDKFKQWAKDLGLNSEDFNACLDSGKYAQKVQDDYQEGVAKGVNGTPGTFVNGQLISGALPYETFKQIIDNLLNQ